MKVDGNWKSGNQFGILELLAFITVLGAVRLGIMTCVIAPAALMVPARPLLHSAQLTARCDKMRRLQIQTAARLMIEPVSVFDCGRYNHHGNVK